MHAGLDTNVGENLLGLWPESLPPTGVRHGCRRERAFYRLSLLHLDILRRLWPSGFDADQNAPGELEAPPPSHLSICRTRSGLLQVCCIGTHGDSTSCVFVSPLRRCESRINAYSDEHLKKSKGENHSYKIYIVGADCCYLIQVPGGGPLILARTAVTVSSSDTRS